MEVQYNDNLEVTYGVRDQKIRNPLYTRWTVLSYVLTYTIPRYGVELAAPVSNVINRLFIYTNTPYAVLYIQSARRCSGRSKQALY